MTFICPVCEIDPTSHSLKNLGTRNDVTYFYTRPAIATKYDDYKGILHHYNGVLSENANNWIWVFDCKGFTTKHLFEIQVGIGLAKLITQKFSHNLNQILIINPTWHVKTVIDLVSPFLNKKLRSIIVIQKKENDNEYYDNTFN
jgi:hypothetical protein